MGGEFCYNGSNQTEIRGEFMEDKELVRLSALNQIALSDAERGRVYAFFEAREAEREKMRSVDLVGTDMTVHVLPTEAGLREDEVDAPFSREEMMKSAPATDAGYFCVPRVLD